MISTKSELYYSLLPNPRNNLLSLETGNQESN